MSHRVPDLDANHGGSSGLNHRDHLDIRSGKGEAGVGHLDHSAVCFEQEEGDLAQHRKQASVHVPENVFSYHIPWMERESENNNKHACAMGQECMPAGEAPLSHLPFQDDEMLSWLQYPLEDSFDRNYCSEQLFEQAPKSPSHHVQDLFSSQSEKLPAIGLPSQPTELFHSNMGGRKVATDTAIAMGAHRVLGLLPHAGAEAFHFHRALTTGQPSAPREICDVPAPEATNTLHTTPYAMDSHSVFSLPSQNVIKQNALNFSLFSGPVAATKTSLQIMGTSSGPSNMKRIRQPYITHGNEGLSSVAESTAAASVTGLSFLVESDSGDQVKGMKQGTSSTLRQKALPPMLSMRRDNNAVKEEVKLNACLKMSATIGSESFETVDVTLTSHSGGSGNSTEKSAKETVAFSCKRKSHPAEDSECESKDAEEVAAREQQPAPAGGRPSPTKRTRAAEIHNQSERRRRNKINDRMKALQELIPNANKSDKASMLDEAIEYVKTLQAQLQLMSMRTGMVVPSVITPPGMQYPALSQQRALSHSHMNMGMGVSTVLGMGMSDASATSVSVGHAVNVALPSFHGQPAPAPAPGPAYNVAGYQRNGWSSSVVHQAQSHMHINEKHDSTQQLQPLHLNMHMDANMYRAFMQQQRGNQKLENPTSEEIPNNEER